jgi:hypothetical protein
MNSIDIFYGLAVKKARRQAPYVSYMRVMVVASEVMPTDVRTASFSLACSLATTTRDFMLAISTLLTDQAGNKAASEL